MNLDLEQLVNKIALMVSSGQDQWMDLFYDHIVPNNDPNADDLLYFVRKSPPIQTNVLSSSKVSEDILFVRRKTNNSAKGMILTKDESDDVRWKETFYLNLIVQLKCFLTVAICKKKVATDGKPTMSAESYVTKRVYASPNKTRMDKKGAEYSCSFPLIYFNVEDFEDAFSNIIINNDEYFCVELCVNIPKSGTKDGQRKVIIFQGAVGWDALSDTFQKRAGSIKDDHIEYIMMRGPHGKGHSQVAVSIPTSNSLPSDSSSNLNSTSTTSTKSTASSGSTNNSNPFGSIGRRNFFQDLLKLGMPQETPRAIERLKFCLTFVNVSWQSIVNDINGAIIKTA